MLDENTMFIRLGTFGNLAIPRDAFVAATDTPDADTPNQAAIVEYRVPSAMGLATIVRQSSSLTVAQMCKIKDA